MSGLNERDEPEPDPVTVEPAGDVVRPRKALPVWVRLTLQDGTERTQWGFAQAWTRGQVLVQVQWQMSYYMAAREFWVEASAVTRREIQPQWLGRE